MASQTPLPWVSLDHPDLPVLIAKLIGLPASEAPARLDTSFLRQWARGFGWAVERRTPLTALSGRAAPPSLIRVGDRVLLARRRGRTWILFHPEGEVRLPSQVVADGVSVAGRRGNPGTPLDPPAWSQSERDEFQRIQAAYPELVENLLLDGTTDTWEIRFEQQLGFDRQGRPSLMVSSMKILGEEKGMLLGLLVLAGSSVGLGYLTPKLGASLIDAAIERSPVTGVLALMTVVLTVAAVLGLVRSLFASRLAARLRLRFTKVFLFRVLGARLDRLRRFGDGDLITRMADLSVLQSLASSQLLGGLFLVLTLLGSSLFLFVQSPEILLLVLGTLIVSVPLAIYYVPGLKEITDRQLAAGSRFRDRLLERIRFRDTLRLFDVKGTLMSRVDVPLLETARLGHEFVLRSSAYGVLSGLTGSVLLVSTAGIVFLKNQSGQLSMGQSLVCLGLAAAVHRGLGGLSGLVSSVVMARPSLDRLKEVMIESDPEPPWTPRPEQSGAASINLEDVSVSWPVRGIVLSGITFDIRSGEWVGLVGASGAGKSTLAALLGGITARTSGDIRLDGLAVMPEDVGSLRENIRVVTESTYVLARSVRENLLFGLDPVSEADLARAMEVSDLRSVVAKWPRGLDHVLGTDGVDVSAGEKVRIALARALLRKPGLIVLDEVLGRFDPDTANRVTRGLRSLPMSVLLITHELTRLEECDRVIVLDGGRVVQSGTYQDERNRGPLARMLSAGHDGRPAGPERKP